MSSTVTGVKSSGGGYRHVLKCVEYGNLASGEEAAFTAQYGGILFLGDGSSTIMLASLVVDSVYINPSTGLYTAINNNGCTVEIPFGTSVKVRPNGDTSKYILYKYVRYKES